MVFAAACEAFHYAEKKVLVSAFGSRFNFEVYGLILYTLQVSFLVDVRIQRC